MLINWYVKLIQLGIAQAFMFIENKIKAYILVYCVLHFNKCLTIILIKYGEMGGIYLKILTTIN